MSTRSSSETHADECQTEKKGWYLGKYLSKARSRFSSANKGDPNLTSRSTSLPLMRSSSHPQLLFTSRDSAPTQTSALKCSSLPQVGTVRVESHGVKYLSSNIARPSFSVSVEGDTLSSALATFDMTFAFSDISSEVLITVLEEYFVPQPLHVSEGNLNTSSSDRSASGAVVGQIVLPVAQYLHLTQASAPTLEWRLFFPLYNSANSKLVSITSDDSPLPAPEPISIGRFRAARYLGTSAQTGLRRPREAIGFMRLRVTVFLPAKVAPYRLYFAEISPFANASASVAVQRKKSSVQATTRPASIQWAVTENLRRVKAALQTPAFIRPFTRLPETFVLTGLVSLICIGAAAWQFPFIIFAGLLFNGLLVRVSEGSKPLPIWNDPFVTSSASIVGIHSDSASSTMSPDQALSEAAFAYAEILDVFATTVEKVSGALSFADSKMSVIVYAVLSLVALLASLTLALIPARLCMAIFVTFMSLVLASAQTLTVQTSATHDDSTSWLQRATSTTLTAMRCFWDRLPDGPELEHRAAAIRSLVWEDGPEFDEARDASGDSVSVSKGEKIDRTRISDASTVTFTRTISTAGEILSVSTNLSGETLAVTS